jgi:ABC-type nitrate/sulfonate/bicarbonate transport system permease component
MTEASRRRWGYPLATLIASVLLWAVLVSALDVPAYLLPHPVEVGRRLIGNTRLYANAAVATTVKVLLGGAVGTLGGFLFGVAVGEIPPLWRAVSPYLIAARVLPVVSVAPLLLIYIGTGFLTGVAFVALMALFPMAVSTAAGFRDTPAAAIDLAQSVDASQYRVLLSIRLPYAVPTVVGGVRQSVTLSVVGAVLAEWFVADAGLGYLILVGAENLRPDVVFAALSVVFLVGFAFYGAVAVLGSRLRRAVE